MAEGLTPSTDIDEDMHDAFMGETSSPAWDGYFIPPSTDVHHMDSCSPPDPPDLGERLRAQADAWEARQQQQHLERQAPTTPVP